MPYVVHEGLKISFEVQGAGEPVLFLPGTTMDSAAFLVGTATYLQGHRSVMVDPRDTVKSDSATAPYTPADLAREALAVLDAAEESTAHVLGYSLGGAVAQELALLAPERVRSLILVCTWARSDGWLSHVFESIRDGLLASGPEGMKWADKQILALTFSAPVHEEPVYQGFEAIMASRGQTPEGLARQLDCDIAHDCLDRLGSIRAPTVVIGAREDKWVPVRYSIELAGSIPEARLEVISDAVHGFPIERPQELYEHLRNQIEK